MTTTQRISFNPDPPVQGQACEICYNFTGTGLTANTLRVILSPPETSTDHDVTPENPCFTIQIPAAAEAILVEDLNGPSPDNAAIIKPV